MSAAAATVHHVADADDCREPFDWSGHTVDETETDTDYRKRLIDAYDAWGALVTEMVESSGPDLDAIGKVLDPPVTRRTSAVTACWCQPEVFHADAESLSDFRDRVLAKFGTWGNALTARDGMVKRRIETLTVVHRRPIEYDIVTGEGRVESRWA